MKTAMDRILPVSAPLVRRALLPYKARRRAQFAALPDSSGRVVFLGDSITQFGMWEELFPDLSTSNRGINGDTVGDVIARVDDALRSPRVVSVMIGTNDLHGLGPSTSPAVIASQIGELIAVLHDLVPRVPLILNSVTPRSPLFTLRIRDLNARCARLADGAGVRFVDLWPTFADGDGAIRPELTMDGIHLSPAGYNAWAKALRPALDEALSAST